MNDFEEKSFLINDLLKRIDFLETEIVIWKTYAVVVILTFTGVVMIKAWGF